MRARAQAQVEPDQPDGVARPVDRRVDHQGHEPQHDQHHQRGPPQGPPPHRPTGPVLAHQQPHDGPGADGQHGQGVAHVGLHEEGPDEGQAHQSTRLARPHQPRLEQQEGEEREGEIGVPQLLEDPRSGGPVGQGDHGQPRDHPPQAPRLPRQAGDPGHGHPLQEHAADQRGPGPLARHPGEQGQEVVHGRPGVVPAEPAPGAGERGVRGEGPHVADAQVQGGLVPDGHVDPAPPLDQDDDDRQEGHDGDGHGRHGVRPDPPAAGPVRRPARTGGGGCRGRHLIDQGHGIRRVGRTGGIRSPRARSSGGDCRGGPRDGQ